MTKTTGTDSGGGSGAAGRGEGGGPGRGGQGAGAGPTNGPGLGEENLRRRVRALLDAYDPAITQRLDFLRARFDAGLAWVHFPEGLGGLGAPRALQTVVDAELAAAGAPVRSRCRCPPLRATPFPRGSVPTPAGG